MTDDHIPAPAEHSPRKRQFIAGGTAHQPVRVVVGEGETLDEVQESGAWISSDTVQEVRQ